jgi:sugar phosphate isomerase/epimerase
MNRRTFLATSAAVPALGISGLAAAQTPNMKQTVADHNSPIQLGVATYSFRQFQRAAAIKMTKELGISNVNIKDFHLSMKDSPEDLKKAHDQFTKAGLKVIGGGTVTMQKDEQLRPAFEYAKAAGLPMMVIAPSHETLPAINKLVQEYGIAVAIHNHGTEDKHFPSPYDVLTAVKGMDPKVGLCIDIGHTSRTGVDVVQSIADAGPRLLGMHVKDLADSTARESQVEVGRGVLPIVGVFKQLIKMNYKGTVDLEYEIKEYDPMPGMVESFAYMRGVLDTLKAVG